MKQAVLEKSVLVSLMPVIILVVLLIVFFRAVGGMGG